MMNKLSFGLIFLLFSLILFLALSSANAATLQEVSQCNSSADCVLLSVEGSGDNLTAVMANRNGSIWYIDYDLVAPSANTTFTEATPYNGRLTLEVQNSYNLSNSTHYMSMYYSEVTPGLGLNSNTDPSQQYLYMGITTEGLLSGTGTYSAHCCDSTIFDNTLNLGFQPCVADGCGIDVLVNLLFLNYTDVNGTAVLNFNFAEQGSLLMSWDDYYLEDPLAGGYLNDRDFYVQAVPVPAAVWLFVSGAIMLVRFAKRKK